MEDKKFLRVTGKRVEKNGRFILNTFYTYFKNC